jgi:hypothetical protein
VAIPQVNGVVRKPKTLIPAPHSFPPSLARDIAAKKSLRYEKYAHPVTHHRRPRVRLHTYTTSPHTASSSFALFSPPLSPSSALHKRKKSKNKGQWKKLAILIEGGKKALQSEVVVVGGAEEDEVDDGTTVWEEEEEHHPSLSSVKRAGSKHSAAAPSFPMPSASPQHGGFDIPPSVSSSSSVTLLH